MSEVAAPRWHAWAGLALGPAAWGIDQQLSSMWSYAACHPGIAATLTVGVACLSLAVVGGALSWRRWRLTRHSHDADHAQEFFALLSVVAAAYFALTILVGTGAALILQECWR
jgi:hypothetical protein